MEIRLLNKDEELEVRAAIEKLRQTQKKNEITEVLTYAARHGNCGRECTTECCFWHNVDEYCEAIGLHKVDVHKARFNLPFDQDKAVKEAAKQKIKGLL
jgi:hypothetical protein